LSDFAICDCAIAISDFTIMRIKTKDDRRQRIKYRLRKRTTGSTERPRLTVFRSVSHIYVQVVDDMSGQTIASASTVEPTVKGSLKKNVQGGNIAGAKVIGKAIAERLLEKGVKRVVFDRNGFLYHGRVKAVADAAREAGLEF
jgi:large subunit ribosomal protein L18